MNLTPEERELAKEAKEVRESPAYKIARTRAETRLLNELRADPAPTNERKLDLIGELRAFQAVDQELKSVADDLSMARRHA